MRKVHAVNVKNTAEKEPQYMLGKNPSKNIPQWLSMCVSLIWTWNQEKKKKKKGKKNQYNLATKEQDFIV